MIERYGRLVIIVACETHQIGRCSSASTERGRNPLTTFIVTVKQ